MVYLIVSFNFSLQNKALIIIAKRNSGKSILIKYLVKDAIKHNEFQKIFVISSTNSINKFYNDIVPSCCIFEKYSEEWTNTLIFKMSEKNQGKTRQSDNPYNVLLILDGLSDCFVLLWLISLILSINVFVHSSLYFSNKIGRAHV